jgi:hypothetical protein
LTRAITIIALACFLVVGAAAASILGRNSVPVAGAVTAPPVVVQKLVSNKEGKQDRLAVAALALAAFEPPQPAADLAPLRQAFAAQIPAEIAAPKMVAPAAMPAAPLAQPAPAAKAAAKPALQKPYALLSDEQIAGIKGRLKLSPDQESYWPAVETALRAVARKIHATRQTEPRTTGVPIDPDSAEVQQLKSAAMPLLFQLREDQKREVRSLARLIGLDRVASMI